MNTLKLLALIFLTVVSGKAKPEEPQINLYEYEGRYQYINNSQINLVVGTEPHLLYAIIDGARYLLRPHKKDIFLNMQDAIIKFVRNGKGRLVGYRENLGPVFARSGDNTADYSRMFVAKPIDKPDNYQYSPPTELNDGLMIRTLLPESELTAQLNALTTAIYDEAYPYTQSVLIAQHGELVFEEYFYEYHQHKQHQMRSATKTLSSLLVGIALDRGLIRSVDTPVMSYFEDEGGFQNPDQRKAEITLKHLLSMQSGFACNDYDFTSPGNETKKNQSEDWVKFMLDLPMQYAPGEVGMYCSGNVTLINRIIEIVSGKSLVEFADQVLFEPLGIDNYCWDFKPDRSSMNNFNQAYMLPRDMMKLGLLIQNQGFWAGKNIVSERWINELSTVQSEINGTPYGYLFWLRYLYLDGSERIEVPQISGNGGQKIIILNEMNAVVVLTGGNYNAQSFTNELLDEFIIDGLKNRNKQVDDTIVRKF